jgi:uncharacterized membrane protein YhaH (DUF805 family)
MNWWALFFGFSGRISRSRYWLCVLVFYLSIFAAVFVPDVVIKADTAVILVLAAFWIHLAAAAKRLHDLDKSAWWLILWLCIPGGQILLGVLPGTPGVNRYGVDPLSTLQAA